MMKKFLSSLLALTMILSLVIVPANAADDSVDQNGFSVSVKGGKTSAVVGDEVTFVANAPSTVTVTDGNNSETSYTGRVTAYSWSIGNAYTAGTTTNEREFTATAKTAAESGDTIKATCEFTVSYEKTSGSTTTIKVSKTASLPVVSKQAAFEAAAKTVSYAGRTYTVSSNAVTIDLFGTEALPAQDTITVAVTGYPAQITSFTAPSSDSATGSLVIGTGKDGDTSSVTITVRVQRISNATVTIKKNNTTVTGNISALTNQEIALTATYSQGSAGQSAPKYKWTRGSSDASVSSTSSYTFKADTKGSYTVACNVYEGNSTEVAATASVTIVVADDPRQVTANDYSTAMATNSSQPLSFKFTDKSLAAGSQDITSQVGTVTWDIEPKNVAYISGSGTSVTLNSRTSSANNVAVTATFTYQDVEYKVTFSNIKISALEADLDAIENGKTGTYSRSELKSAAQTAINSQYSRSSDYETVESITPPVLTSSSTLGTLSTADFGSSSSGYITFNSKKGAIGNAKITLTATAASGRTYTVTLNIPVTPIKTTYESQYPQPSGTSSNYKYSVDVPDGYYSYYVVAKNPSKAPTNYSERLSGTKNSYSGSSLYPLSGSDFDKSGKCELYVVTYEKNDDTAYCGVITVYQKSYNIKYSVVAGESVTFSQKDFESFLEDIADDSSDYNSRKDTLELSYVKFSLPNSTREGVLYEGKSKIDRNDKVEDLDKVTFESVAKAKDTITISFTAYGKLYKDGASKGKDVDYSGNVVISVVKEDIVFEVGVNSAIKLGSDKFIDFLRDSDKSYKKADLDYVTFDVGKNSAITSYFNGTGALYRYYNGSTGINATVSAKDEFYYNPKTSSKHYDLDDVTYVTSKFAKVGDIVYIPFTAYGTKSGQKAEGTLAIKVKQTMNFVDVRPGDYFYDSVQWAVNLDITKGTSATTFSPKQGCTRAQIVTFLWRAANSPAPRSSTNKFTDVYATTHADYMKAIIWATEQGITTGTGNGKFSPDDTCTRAQIVTFLYRFKNNPAVYGSLNFSDVNKTEHAAFYNAILWAVNNKITTGYGNGIFDPNGTCNRGDAVTFLYRALA